MGIYVQPRTKHSAHGSNQGTGWTWRPTALVRDTRSINLTHILHREHKLNQRVGEATHRFVAAHELGDLVHDAWVRTHLPKG